MNRLAIAITLAALIVGCSENNKESKDTKAAAKTGEQKMSQAAADATFYEEVTAKNGRIYVLGAKASADKAKAGSLPVIATTKVGHGPKGETVVFEADAKNEALEKRLMAEYAKRHAKMN